MAPKAHSDFPASSAARLLNCPGSYELGRQQPAYGVRTSSIYSAEGSLAHAMSEACLLAGLDTSSFLGQTRSIDGFTYTLDEDFVAAVEVYVGFVRGLRALGYQVMLEERVSPQGLWTGLDPLPIDLFGTADCIAINAPAKRLIIGDLKFGKGVAVNVTGNSQLLYYGAGALAMIMQMANVPDIKEVELVIVQPRAPHVDGPIRSVTYTVEEVREWARVNLYDGVKRALADNGKTLVPSDHCRWCPASPTGCPELLNYAAETAKRAFRNAPVENIPANDPTLALPSVDMSDARLADLLDRIAIVGPWMERLKQVALERAEAGANLPGWKLVPKRPRRIWPHADDKETIAALKNEGLHEDQFTRRTLLSPAQVEKEVGKKLYGQLVQPHVGKSSSGLTLASDDDPRKRVAGRTAQEAFNLNPAHNEGNENG
jgi:hypothetical protein